MAEEKIIGIDKLDVPDKKKVNPLPNQDYFEALMRQRNVSSSPDSAVQVEVNNKTIVDEVEKLNTQMEHATRLGPDALVEQAHFVINKMDSIKEQLGEPGLTIRKSEQDVLRKRLSHIDESLKIALTNAGVEYTPPQKVGFSTPIERFLGMLAHGQQQLHTLADTVHSYSLKRAELNPATMLLLQIKVGFIQQELELFTSMLNKALESTKTIMNVQV